MSGNEINKRQRNNRDYIPCMDLKTLSIADALASASNAEELDPGFQGD